MRIIIIRTNKGSVMDNLSSVTANTIILKESATVNQNSTIYSNTLFAYSDVVLIRHQGDQYFLRLTRNGKLILTK